jgi:uncharacterized protein YndB with AHSA1/START domain
MLKKIALGIAALIAAILLFATTKPATFSVARSIVINAPPETVQAQLTDFHKWQAWSPWEKLDPAMKRTYSGPDTGKGAVYTWEGNSAVGQGRMEITDVTPNTVAIQLDFMAPMETSNQVAFALTPQGDSTNVHWVMSGANNYLSKVMQVFVSMDKMIGKDFESGLVDLKTAAEATPAPRSAPPTTPTP